MVRFKWLSNFQNRRTYRLNVYAQAAYLLSITEHLNYSIRCLAEHTKNEAWNLVSIAKSAKLKIDTQKSHL